MISFAYEKCLESVFEPQNSSRTNHVAAESLVTGLHCRVKDCTRWKNLMNTFFRNAIFIGNFDKTTLLCMRSAWISNELASFLRNCPAFDLTEALTDLRTF